MSQVVYTPPATVKQFIRDRRDGSLFYDWIVGPVGSGKTTGIFFKLVHLAKLQAPGPDGKRRSRAVVVRNTKPQLRDTTLASWFTWFKPGIAGDWYATPWNFVLKFDDVECEVLFRALDTADDVARVLSLEVTFAILDEFVEIPRDIIDALSARLGRYPSNVDGGATNWGMWGSSNPSTEDNWWYEYLHEQLPENARYFLQPSGLAPEAENIENLPGGREYYVQQAKGKTEAWIKQFIEAQWGYSAAGKSVVPSFRKALHVSETPLTVNPLLPLIIGLDPGLGGAALIFGQEDWRGRLLVYDEIVEQGMGIERLLKERALPLLKQRYAGMTVTVAPDPAAANRAQTDEKSVVDIVRRYLPVTVESNNRLPLRLNAIEHYTTKLVEGAGGLLIDKTRCPVLVRALGGGWRYAVKGRSGEVLTAEPEKNQYSHPGDAFGYLARYFHRQAERYERARGGRAGARPLPRTFGGASYHVR